jgi:putative iron-dependent peroxidase
MDNSQAGILQPIPKQARHLLFSLAPDLDPRAALRELTTFADGASVVVGLGDSLLKALDAQIHGMKLFPAYTGKGFDVPSTPQALWCWQRGNDRGDLVHQTLALRHILEPVFVLDSVIDAFEYGHMQDLTGFEDGTENPQDAEAVAAAIVNSGVAGMDGSSFAALQQWVHDLELFFSQSAAEQDNVFGRHKADNEEFDEAPASAHVKRTAQESFSPEAFVVRRSMPWADAAQEGLMFLAFGHSLDAFEAQLKRMVGAEDGITDALFTFTRPVTGSYFWCPPLSKGKLDLSAVGLN